MRKPLINEEKWKILIICHNNSDTRRGHCAAIHYSCRQFPQQERCYKHRSLLFNFNICYILHLHVLIFEMTFLHWLFLKFYLISWRICNHKWSIWSFITHFLPFFLYLTFVFFLYFRSEYMLWTYSIYPVSGTFASGEFVERIRIVLTIKYCFCLW